MTEPNRERLPEAPVVPLEYAGLWIAWNHEHTRIIASGQTIEAACKAALAAGESEPILGRAPDAEIHFVGEAR